MTGETTTVETVVIPPPGDHRSAQEQQALVIARLIVGFIQGVALYLLYLSVDNHSWPASDPYWMSPLLMVFVFVPLLFQQAVGTMRLRTLLIWIVAATAILAVLAVYDIWRQWQPKGIGDSSMTFALIAFSVVGLFIAQSLIAAADVEKRWFATYTAYFDAAWKLGVQLALAAAFVGVFWGVLWLGAVLFNLINLHFIEDVIEKTWFAIPATTLATAAAIHVTDVRARLVAGIRTVALTLLSWILPLMTLIAVGFVASLPFTGLEPLWSTKSAASLLLTAAAVLVILINAAFQDGDPAHKRPIVLRYAELAAALVLVPLVLIASYALWLRVAQYGWTVERIATAATVIVAICYAFGYAAAAILSLLGGSWMALMTRVNVATAFVVLALLIALFSPIADPTRLAVDNQIGRLKSGAVSAAAFDYNYLQQEGGRFGHAALEDMARSDWGKDTALVRKSAKATLAGVVLNPPPTAKSDLIANVTVYPNTRALPQTFLNQDWTKVAGAPGCLTTVGNKCDAVFANFDGADDEEIAVYSVSDSYFWATILKLGKNKQWSVIGTVNGYCEGMIGALRRGDLTLAEPPRQLRDWVVLGVRLHPTAMQDEVQPCPGR